MQVHKTEVVENKDGSYYLNVELFGNQTELAALAAGRFNVAVVKPPQVLHPDDPTHEVFIDNPNQLDLHVELHPVPFETLKPAPTLAEARVLNEKARGGLPNYDERNPHLLPETSMGKADPLNSKSQNVGSPADPKALYGKADTVTVSSDTPQTVETSSARAKSA